MGLSIALGWCWGALAGSIPGFQPIPPEATFLLGARDLDPPEAALLSNSRVTRVPVSAVPQLSDLLGSAGLGESLGYLHLDLDALDSEAVGPANDHPVPGGLSVANLCGAIAVIRARVPLGAATIASYDPAADQTQAVCRAAFAALDAVLAPASS
jgi:arginase